MSKSTVTGEVAAVSDYRDKDYFNIALDDPEKDENWYIGDGSVDVEKGDRVRISFDTNKGSITEIDVIGGDSEDGASRGSDRQDSPMGENAADPSSLTPKDTRIMVQTAFKEACQDVRHYESLHDEEMDNGRKLDRVSELTNGYFNLMKAQVKDKTGGEQ